MKDKDELFVQSQHRLVEALAASERASRLRLDNLLEIVIEVDASGLITYLNRAWERLLGRDASEALGKPLASFMAKEDGSDWDAYRLADDLPTAQEFRLLRVDGTPRLFEIMATRGDEGGITASLYDITESRQAADKLRQAQLRYQAILDNSFNFIGLLDTEGRLVDANLTALNFAGVAAEDVLGKPFWETAWWKHSAEEQVRLKAAIDRAVGGETVGYETSHSLSDGSMIRVDFSIKPIFDQDGRIVFLLPEGRDITARTEAEERFRQVVEASPSALLLVDEKGFITLMNPEAEACLGYRRDELIGRTVESVVPQVHRSRHSRLRKAYLKSPTARPMNSGRELTVLRKDGSEFPAEVSLSPIHTAKGTLVLSSLTDITERKRFQSDLYRAKEAAETANRAKSEFLANMSHEIRTPLAGVLSAAELLWTEKLTPVQREYVDIIRLSGNNLLELIDEILDLSKVEAGKLELEAIDFDPREILESISRIMSLRAREKGLEFIHHVEPDVPPMLKGDPGRLRQILMNLLGNAIKFSHSGVVSLLVYLESETAASVTLRLSVSDTGIGIPEDRFEHIFMPFQQVDASTSRRFGGTGLGLSITRKLVELMGGNIWLSSEQGVGSTFYFTVELEKTSANPAEGRPPPPAAESLRAKPAKSKSSRRALKVLLAEDNPVNQKVTLAILRRLGHDCASVGNGHECIEALSCADYDLVLMDCQMPILDGYETTRLIRNPSSPVRNHGVPVIALTAHATTADRDRCYEAGMNEYMTKPIEWARLESILADWLDSGARRQARGGRAAKKKKQERLPMFDRNELLRRVMGDEDILNQLVATFLEDIPRRLLALRELLAADDLPGVRLEAHAIKGAAANVSAEALRFVADAMELAAISGNFSTSAAMAEQLGNEFEGLRGALEGLLQEAKGHPASDS